MYGRRGLHVNRFDEVLRESGTAPENYAVDLKNLSMSLTLDLKRKFDTVYRSMHASIDEVKNVFDVTDSYVSVKRRRVVSAAKAVDNTDLVTKEQLIETTAELKKILLNDFDLKTKSDLLPNKHHKRSGTVSKSKEPSLETLRAHLNLVSHAVNTIKPECFKTPLPSILPLKKLPETEEEDDGENSASSKSSDSATNTPASFENKTE